MTEQTALPVADESTGDWETPPLWSKIDEPSPSDADFVESSDNPDDDAFHVEMGDTETPETGAGSAGIWQYLNFSGYSPLSGPSRQERTDSLRRIEITGKIGKVPPERGSAASSPDC